MKPIRVQMRLALALREGATLYISDAASQTQMLEVPLSPTQLGLLLSGTTVTISEAQHAMSSHVGKQREVQKLRLPLRVAADGTLEPFEAFWAREVVPRETDGWQAPRSFEGGYERHRILADEGNFVYETKFVRYTEV